MKPSTVNNWADVIAWPVKALIVWWIWNTWVSHPFNLPEIDWLTAFMWLWLISCFRSSYGYLLGEIANSLEKK
jgi:hypothetical protein